MLKVKENDDNNSDLYFQWKFVQFWKCKKKNYEFMNYFKIMNYFKEIYSIQLNISS